MAPDTLRAVLVWLWGPRNHITPAAEALEIFSGLHVDAA